MVDKGDSDDQLIDALKEENQRLRDALQKVMQKSREDTQARVPREARGPGVSAVPTETSQLETEIVRLNRLVKQQVNFSPLWNAKIHSNANCRLNNWRLKKESYANFDLHKILTSIRSNIHTFKYATRISNYRRTQYSQYSNIHDEYI